MKTSDFTTVELNQIKLSLREDLEFSFQRFGEQDCYVVEDPIDSAYYRVGLAEYTFISLLDGNTSVADALLATSAKLGRDAFTSEDAASICKWLIDSQLASTPQSAGANRLLGAANKESAKRRLQWLNPLMLKVPLFNPDPLFRVLLPVMRMFVSLPALLVWIATIVVAAYHLAIHWDRTTRASAQILAHDNWLWLGASFLVLKLLHETFHGLVCRRFGGNVREGGVLFVLFAPIPYVDVSSCWRFPSKWQRIATSSAGMYVELFVAAVAAIVWSHADVGLVSHHAFNIMLLGSVTTVFFNLNPLMRFDGYYILADLLELPNLYSRGQQYLSYLARRYMLGVKLTAPAWRAPKRLFVKIYGMATFVWRFVICVCLLVAAESLFFGAGIVVAVIAVLMWFAVPLCRVTKYIICGQGVEQPSILRFATVSVLLAGAMVSLVVYVPWPGATRAEAVVEYRDANVLRVGAAGFVSQLNVRPGNLVRSGDVLAVLDNPALQAELDDLQLSIRQTELRTRRFHAAGEIAAEQVEIETRNALEQRLAELQGQAAKLTVLARVDGRVVADELDAMLGTYLQDGDELMTIADERRKQLRVSIAQDDIQRFQSSERKPIRVRLVGSPLDAFTTELDEIEPRASSEIPHAALAAPGGGSLPVKSKSTSAGSSTGDSDHWELLAPRFLATINLNSQRSLALKTGQTGSVTFRDGRESIGEHLYRAAQRWLRDRLQLSLFD